MTVERVQRQIVFHCDARRCAEVFESDTDMFVVAWTKAREEGWTTKLDASDWVHTCPDCQ